VLALAREYNVPPERIMFDRGGGGYEHACTLRKLGYNVRTIAFGSTLSPDKKMRGVVSPLKERIKEAEVKYVYKNRRAEMYHLLRLQMNPANGIGFALSKEYHELRRQLAPVPLRYDEEGRIYLPPKNLKPGDNEDKETMVKLIGCSPDQSDALVLAIYGLLIKDTRTRITSMV